VCCGVVDVGVVCVYVIGGDVEMSVSVADGMCMYGCVDVDVGVAVCVVVIVVHCC